MSRSAKRTSTRRPPEHGSATRSARTRSLEPRTIPPAARGAGRRASRGVARADGPPSLVLYRLVSSRLRGRASVSRNSLLAAPSRFVETSLARVPSSSTTDAIQQTKVVLNEYFLIGNNNFSRNSADPFG